MEIKTEENTNNNIHAYVKPGNRLDARKPEISAAVRGGKVCVKIKEDNYRYSQSVDDLDIHLFNKPLQDNHYSAAGDGPGCEP